MVHRCWHATSKIFGLFLLLQSLFFLQNKKVFKYKNGRKLLTLGELFVPGDDQSHFCKPTDVVISDVNKDIYISDGYCNSRVVKYNSNGTFIREFQMSKEEKALFIPHSVIILSSLQLLCVADRENGRFVFRL